MCETVDNSQFENISPDLKKKTSKSGVLTTPPKKCTHFFNGIERAAKKEDSFRDLPKIQNKWNQNDSI